MFVCRHDLRSDRHYVEDLQAQVHLVFGERSVWNGARTDANSSMSIASG